MGSIKLKFGMGGIKFDVRLGGGGGKSIKFDLGLGGGIIFFLDWGEASKFNLGVGA